MLSFKPAIVLSSFTFIKRHFSSASNSDISVESSAYLGFFIFLLAILIPACNSFKTAFHMMYSVYKLNKQGNNIQPWCIPFQYGNSLFCSMSNSNCCFLICIQFSLEAGQVVWGSYLFQNFPQFIVIHMVKDFGIVNKAEVDFIFWISLAFFDDPMDVGNLSSGSTVFSKSRLNICKFLVHILLKPHLENFPYCFASMWDEANCVVVWSSFAIAFLWDWNENWPLPFLLALLSFQNLLAYWVQHLKSIVFWDLKLFNWNSFTSTSFVCSDASQGSLDFTKGLSEIVIQTGKPKPEKLYNGHKAA